MTDHPSPRPRDSRPSDRHLLLHTPLRHLFAPLHRCILTGRFGYSADAPFIVRLDLILDAGIEVTWYVGRDLFAAGLLAPSGDGDVRVWPANIPQQPRFFFSLRDTDAQATFEAGLEAVRDWLDSTYRIVPAGAETQHVNWDAAADLLRS